MEVVDTLLGFSSYAYHANGSAFYANVRATGSDDLDWGPDHLTTAYVWPSGENLRFYAIHPYDATAISNPGTFYRYDSTEPVNYDWNDSHPTNAWSANNASNDANTTVVKTVYDPCPVGYHMPQRNAFTGFTSTGGNTSDAAQFNVSGSFVRGWNFWTNSTHASTIFFPASGYRNYVSGALTRVGSYGCFWSAVPYDTSYGRSLYFGSGSVLPFNANSRAYAFGVRPVKE